MQRATGLTDRAVGLLAIAVANAYYIQPPLVEVGGALSISSGLVSSPFETAAAQPPRDDTSVSFYTRNELACCAINDRSAGKKVIELDLMTEAQHNDLPEEEDVTSADRLIIDSPTSTGLIVMKALAPEPGLMAQAQGSLAASSCSVQSEQPVKPPEPPARPQARR